MQYKLFSFLKKLDIENNLHHQIFVSTHSSNISAVAGLDNMYLLNYKRDETNNCVVFASLKEQFKDDIDAKKHLTKFFDVTRSDMLFADRIILVEGISERLLLPAFMKKLNYEYEDNHISIIEIGGKNFKYFLRTFVDNDINRKVLCITDNDFSWIDDTSEKDKVFVKTIADYNKNPLDKLKVEERPEHTRYFWDRDNIHYVIQRMYGSTFEDELFIENIENEYNACKLLRLALPSTAHKLLDFIAPLKKNAFNMNTWKSYLENDKLKIVASTRKKIENLLDLYIEAAKKKIEDFEIYNKLFFSKLFLEYVKDRKGDVALTILVNDILMENLNVPTYIMEGLEWLSK
jgi:predicted ATP-dependent endonuclease of OLD family